MNNQDLLRVVDHISREKNIDKFLVFEDLEMAMLSAARKAYGATEDISVKIDRMNGDIDATLNGEPISMKDLGRIAAQTAKQVMIQKIREAERDSIFEEFAERVGQIVTGTVSRIERGAISVNLGRAEGFLPRSEQIPGRNHHPGERIGR
jgi:N utilization substance protein A